MPVFSKFQAVATFGLLASFASVANANAVAGTTCAISDFEKVDCGYVGIDQYGCESKGCCWVPAEMNSNTPWCFYAGATTTYDLVNLKETNTGISAKLVLNGEGSTTYGPDIKNLNLDVIYESADVVRVKITDADNARWEVPESVISRSHATSKPANTNFKFSYTTSPFTFEVTRVSDGRSLFKLDSFKFKDQYLEVPTSYDSNAKTFGLGESARTNHALQTGKTYSMWAADIPSMTLNTNLYGSFPYYVQVVDGTAHGAMLVNSNALDAVLGSDNLTFKSTGGIIDLYVFNGPTPADVVKQYTSIVGKPTMMPYWSLGLHNCKYGYTSLDQVKDIVASYKNADIPLDTQWFDIDYMQNYRDFTYDSVNFPATQVSDFVDQLHKDGQRFVPIIDPGIMTYSGYEAYDRGLAEDLFIKDISGSPYLGQVWPGPTYFPDFFHPKSQNYWTDMLRDFYNMAKVDGIWIDMNEISNFCNVDGNGQVCENNAPNGCPAPGASQTDCCLSCRQTDWNNKYDYPPYRIGNMYGNLGTKTVSPSATHYGNITHYDSHNIYGLTEQIATYNALTTITNKRPFVLSRSSFLSTGVHSAKWTGDNAATWNDLKSSIVGIMDFNLFGVPMIGADICGFIYDTTEELCARWIEVGAFYPFTRVHNTLGAAPQELYLWNTVTEASKYALGARYQLLPYLYSLFYNANSDGETVARALWMNYPSDPTTLNIDSQWMLGKSVLITPVITQGATSVSGYFPKGLWYDFFSRTLAFDAHEGGVWQTIDTPLTKVNVHVKGGSVLPLHQAGSLTTAHARETPFSLVAFLCNQGKADGTLFYDDGEQIALKNNLRASFDVATSNNSGSFTSIITENSFSGDNASFQIKDITIIGPSLSAPTSAFINGKSVQFTFSGSTLTFTGIPVQVNEPFTLTWH